MIGYSKLCFQISGHIILQSFIKHFNDIPASTFFYDAYVITSSRSFRTKLNMFLSELFLKTLVNYCISYGKIYKKINGCMLNLAT
jgi:hypothetical protein